jgi:hypothetical protein
MASRTARNGNGCRNQHVCVEKQEQTIKYQMHYKSWWISMMPATSHTSVRLLEGKKNTWGQKKKT